MSGKMVMAAAVVLALGCFGAQARGGGGVGGAGLPPSMTVPGWPDDNSNRDCYQSRRIHTQHGVHWRRVWVCE